MEIRLPTRTMRRIHRLVPHVVQTVWDDVQEDDCIDLAAQMSFFFVTSLFPFLVVIGAIVGWLPSTNLWGELVQWLTHYLPSGARLFVFRAIFELTQNHIRFFSYGLVATIWIASSGFVSLMESLSIAHGLKDTRSFLRKRTIAVAATLVGAIFTIVSFSLLAFGHRFAQAVQPGLRDVLPFPFPWRAARWAVTAALMLIGLDLINYFLPNVPQRWRWLTPGTAFDAVGIVGTFAAFGYYIRHFADYPRFYGGMAGFIILVICIYAASLIVLIGAEVDSVFEDLRRTGIIP